MNWNTKDENFLKQYYPTVDNKTLSVKLNRTEISLRHKAKQLGIKKTKEYIENYKKNPTIKYNYIDISFDEIKNIALNYKTKTEFSLCDKTIYQKAKRLGKNKFNEICSHMIDQHFSLPQLIMKFTLNKLLGIKGDYNIRTIISPYELDLYYEKFKLAFEYDGKKWHHENCNDDVKNQLCKEKGITLIRIKETLRNKPFDDVLRQVSENINIINIVTKQHFTKQEILSTNFDYREMFLEILDEDLIKKVISKYKFYKDFRKNENALYIKLKRRKLLQIYTCNLIRDNKDKYKNKKIN